MSSVTTGQCPEGFGSPPFMGGTRWIGNGSTLTISSDENFAPPLEVTASSDNTLGRTVTLEVEGCVFEEEINLIVDEQSNRFASGFYSAIYVRGSGMACEVIASMYDIPEQCEVTAEWHALRTSKNP